jgi:transposase InsO family protein
MKTKRKGFVPYLPVAWSRWTRLPFLRPAEALHLRGARCEYQIAFAYTYKANSSANGDDFLGKFLKVAPFTIRNVQTDNGSEFVMHFHDRCSQAGLTHFFNYPSGRTFSVNPKHSQSNGYLERFNRTI